ncbi:MAG: TetR/AcrR family transcriptional regulator [Geovibrio sp.]|uniref:TetR/AcrR family transcriptional regulator n=1 Tax=Geovibrio ferrireducens TaxID=46201 RepID=UPI00224800D2|nr:TetR/AcrR family transcriptional regulator [Geovibrio ferrireducens]MCD8568013.1 TetR/AcrR family transcriptional regulator [Geovibrio sp.]
MIQKKTKNSRTEIKRLAALEAAAELFLGKGYGSVSMDEIAAKAEISKRTLYNYFPAKDLLFGEVVRFIWSGLNMPELPPAKGSDIRETLNSFSSKLLAVLRSERFISLLRLVMGESGRFPELTKFYSENGITLILANLAEYFRECTELGMLKTDRPDIASQQYLGMIKESLFWPVLLGVFPMPSKEHDEDVMEKAADLILTVYSFS